MLLNLRWLSLFGLPILIIPSLWSASVCCLIYGYLWVCHLTRICLLCICLQHVCLLSVFLLVLCTFCRCSVHRSAFGLFICPYNCYLLSAFTLFAFWRLCDFFVLYVCLLSIVCFHCLLAAVCSLYVSYISVFCRIVRMSFTMQLVMQCCYTYFLSRCFIS